MRWLATVISAVVDIASDPYAVLFFCIGVALLLLSSVLNIRTLMRRVRGDYAAAMTYFASFFALMFVLPMALVLVDGPKFGMYPWTLGLQIGDWRIGLTMFAITSPILVVAVILGARSLDDLISRIETVNSISKQDTTLIHHVLGFQHQIVHRRTLLTRERVSQRQLVSARAAERNRAAGRVASERRLYSSVRSQIQQMISRQQAQQAAAASAARAAAKTQAAAPQGSFGVGSPVSSSIPGDRYSSVVGIAMQYLGVPYVWGGESPKGFDCSGLVAYVYAQVGVSLPHYTVAQWNYSDSASVPRDQLEPGDLVFFYGLGHVGIYVGGGNFIHAPHTGSVVRIDSLNGAGYSSAYVGAKRILG